MRITKKDATVTTGPDDNGPGTFHVILSAQTLDRDGDTLKKEDWEQPLPEHITFDQDHGMSVASLVGSGKPFINKDTGNLEVKGTFAGTPEGQKVRQLVKEGHCRTTSVAFMTKTAPQKDGTKKTVRELLNGAFVAIPSNREAVVLSSKALEDNYKPSPYDAEGEGDGEPVTCPNCGKGDALDAVYCDQCGFKLEGADGVDVSKAYKSGARNSKTDAAAIQGIHDATQALGADCPAPAAAGKSARPLVRRKTVAGSYEQGQSAIGDALGAQYNSGDVWAYPIATFDDSVVYRVSGGPDSGQWQASYTIGTDGTATLGTPERVNLVEQILPAKSYRPVRKDADDDPDAMVAAIDAAMDQAGALLDGVDLTTLPAEVQQALAVYTAAETTVDALLDVLGIPDPDDEDEGEPGATGAPATLAAGARSAPAARAKAAPTASEAEELEAMTMRLKLHARLAN